MDRYLPIADHGLIGDLHTVALVGSEGTIDWYCAPRLDSPSIFAAILDRRRGGYYAIRPEGGDWMTKQLYFPDTNVLITRFLTPDGVAELQAFMPVARGRRAGIVTCSSGGSSPCAGNAVPARGRAPLRLRARRPRHRARRARSVLPVAHLLRGAFRPPPARANGGRGSRRRPRRSWGG